jgi:hypothetical protein
MQPPLLAIHVTLRVIHVLPSQTAVLVWVATTSILTLAHKTVRLVMLASLQLVNYATLAVELAKLPPHTVLTVSQVTICFRLQMNV